MIFSIAFDGWPPWRSSHSYSFHAQVESLNKHFAVHLAIMANFWSKFFKLLIFDWKQYFLDKTVISLDVIRLEIESFIHGASKISQTE